MMTDGDSSDDNPLAVFLFVATFVGLLYLPLLIAFQGLIPWLLPYTILAAVFLAFVFSAHAKRSR